MSDDQLLKAGILAATERMAVIAKEEIDRATAGTHIDIAQTMRELAHLYAGQNGPDAIRSLADAIEAAGRKHLPPDRRKDT